MSNIGRKDRQVWYDFHAKGPTEQLNASTRIKFLFGDILERLLIFLASESGHTVEGTQGVVAVDGIVGHTDGIIDGVVVDTKSASSYSYKKFESGDLKDDPFGYVAQLAGYSEGHGGKDGAFLVIDKQMGDITLMPMSKEVLATYNVKERIAHIKEVVKSETPPERCYSPEPYGKSGNESLPIGCSYCKHKHECWADANGGKGLRTFLYSGRPVFFTNVVREPNVPEILIK